MSRVAQEPGRRLFRAGSIGVLAFGAVHVLAVVNSFVGEPPTPELGEISEALKRASLRMGPFEATAWGTTQLLNASFSILMLQLGATNLVVLRPAVAAGRLRALAGTNALFSGLLFAATVAARFPPPMVFAAAVFGLFLGAWLRSGSPSDHSQR